jgi:hypothetical protein
MEHPLTTRARGESRDLQAALRKQNPYASVSERVLVLREELGVGMSTAKRMVEIDDLETEIATAKGMQDIKVILNRMLKLVPIG